MDIIEKYDNLCYAGPDILEKMRRVSIIEDAAEELKSSLVLHPDTEIELTSIGIEPKEFLIRFQETEEGY